MMDAMNPSPPPAEPTAKRLGWPLLGLAVALVLSLSLALNRVYQVDEAQGAYSAWIQGAGFSSQLFTHAPFYLIPFGWAARHADSAEGVFDLLRLGFWGIWWLNLGLLSLAAGAWPWSRKGVFLVLAALLTPPLWTYGLEARHENVILVGLLVLWVSIRRGRGRGWVAFAVLGATSVLLQASAFKAIAYWLPIGVLALTLPHPSFGRRGWLAAGWLGGAVGAALLVFSVEHAAGLWPSFWAEQTRFLHGAFQVERFSPLPTLLKLLRQCPVLVASGLVLGFWYVRRTPLPRNRRAFYEGIWPELLLASACLALLLINPNPFPYNLLTVSASLVLVATALVAELEATIPDRAVRGALLLAAAIAQAIPAGVQIHQLLLSGNERQVELMKAAEALTGPQDRVYDSAGLVPTRKSVGYVWFMNIANVQGFRDGALPDFLASFKATPPAVVIPTYRFNYLDPKDEKEIEDTYVALAPDLWVAGHLFLGPQDAWQCRLGGRYRIKILAGDGSAARLDGQLISGDVLTLSSGIHRWSAPEGTRAAVVWVGPNLSDIPRLSGEPFPGVFPIPNAF